MTIFIPRVDESLNITLPGEILRAIVTKVVNINTCIVEIGQPMTRSHSFRLGDLVACRRTPGVLGEIWQAIEERPTSVAPSVVLKPDMAVKPNITKPAGKPAKQVSKPPKRGKSTVKGKISVPPVKPQRSVGKR